LSKPRTTIAYWPFKSVSLPLPHAEGLAVTMKVTPLLATPPTVTTTLPTVAPLGTGATILVLLQLVGVASVPLNATVLVPCVDPKPAPTIVTKVPTGPEVGDRLVMLGPEPEITPILYVGELAAFGPAALESVTVTAKVIVPAVVGVPERAPAELSDRPSAGSPNAVHVSVPVPPEAVKVNENC
jgi:hypothetical protein